MDMKRDLRFLIPAIVASASVFWSLIIGKKFSVQTDLHDLSKVFGTESQLLSLAAGGSALLAAGYLIGAFSVFVLNARDWLRRSGVAGWLRSRISCSRKNGWLQSRENHSRIGACLRNRISRSGIDGCLGSWSYQAHLPKETIDSLAQYLQVPPPENQEEEILLVNWYVHGVVAKENSTLHAWYTQRWDHYIAAVHIFWALALSLPAGVLIQCWLREAPPSLALLGWWVLPCLALMLMLSFNARRAYKQNWAMVGFICRHLLP